MQALWAEPDGLTVRDVLDRLNRGRRHALAYTTVMTVLSRLHEKAIVDRRRDGRGFRYVPTVDDEAEIAVRDVVREYGDAAVAGFVGEVSGDPQLLARLRLLLAEEP